MSASIPSWAVRGAKVVCVDASISSALTWPNNGDMGGLREGCVYTVRGVGLHSVSGVGGIFVEGIVRRFAGDEPFQFNRFRPLVTRTQEQDLSIFLPLLKTKEAADA